MDPFTEILHLLLKISTVKSTMFKEIYSFITTHNLITPGSRIVVGLSGGPDSVFLLHLLASMRKSHNLRLVAAHLDHEWRSDSAQDIQFCQQLLHNKGLPAHSALLLTKPYLHRRAYATCRKQWPTLAVTSALSQKKENTTI